MKKNEGGKKDSRVGVITFTKEGMKSHWVGMKVKDKPDIDIDVWQLAYDHRCDN